jgi:hypothetical protein
VPPVVLYANINNSSVVNPLFERPLPNGTIGAPATQASAIMKRTARYMLLLLSAYISEIPMCAVVACNVCTGKAELHTEERR